MLNAHFFKKTGSGAFEKSDAIPEVKIVFERKREKRFELTKNKLWSGGRGFLNKIDLNDRFYPKNGIRSF